MPKPAAGDGTSTELPAVVEVLVYTVHSFKTMIQCINWFGNAFDALIDIIPDIY
jgi:hypothetical protein